MAGQTPRFGFNFFGGDTSGSLDDDNDKFTLEDRLLLDRILAALETHDHHGVATLSVPSVEPLAELIPGGGELEAGSTYYYVVSFVDRNGLETIVGPETSVDTPDLLDIPDVPQGETTMGGTLSPGAYTYALSALRDTEETPLSNPSAITILDDGATGEYSVTFTLPDLGEADALQLWRMKDTDSSYTRIAVSSTGTVIDDGSVPAGQYGDPANFVPLVTTGIDNYAVKVSLVGDDITDVASTHGWRLYRSTESGIYSATSLVHEVVERTTDTDPNSPLITEWTDDGDDPFVGSPRTSVATELQVSPLTLLYADPLPDANDYPDYFPIIGAASTLYYALAGVWKPFAGGSGGMTFRGPWVAGDYDLNDVVSHLNALWVANDAATAANPPGVASVWTRIAYTVPPAGITAQVLTKTSDSDGDYAWATATSGGGGGGSAGTTYTLTTAFTTSTDDAYVPIFASVTIPPGELWSFTARFKYSVDALDSRVYFGPTQTTPGTLSYGTMDGEIWYNQTSGTKRMNLAIGLIGTGPDDGGPALTLDSTATPYLCLLQWEVRNTDAVPIDVTLAAFIVEAGPTVTVQPGALLTVANIAPTPADTTVIG